MLARTSCAIVPSHKFPEFLSYVQNSVLPHYQNSQGLISVSLLQRPVVGYVEVLILSIWRSQEALDGFAGNELLVEEIRTRFGAIPMEPRSYEIVASEVRRL